MNVNGKYLCVITLVIFSISGSAYTTQRSNVQDDEGSPFLDMASEFLQSLNQNQGGGGGGGGAAAGLSGIASMLLPLMANAAGGGGSGSSKSGNDGVGAILSGIGSMLANSQGGGGGGGGGFDPALIGNVIQMFAGANEEPQRRSAGSNKRQKRAKADEGNPILDTVLNVAQTWLANQNSIDRDDDGSDREPQHPGFNGETLVNLLPLAVQAFQSFSGPEMEKTQEKHKDHSWVLPPFLEHIHVMWDQFTQSELFQRSGPRRLDTVFAAAILSIPFSLAPDRLNPFAFTFIFLSDKLGRKIKKKCSKMSSLSKRYVATGQMMANGFLQSRGYPKQALLDINRPSETISNLIDHTAKKYLQVKIVSVTYVKPAVNYVKDLLKLGKAKQFLQKYNATELTDKLTDTLNLEVIEPVLKVHRAYRQAIQTPHCDKYILCEINSHDPNERLGLGGFKQGVTRFGSMAASWFISQETQTPFWTLFAIINDPHNCQSKHPVDCAEFHENESKVTTEYPHNEL
ncbi:conserved hypothetical protein [Culex quinquefasciatus]|uniref:Uncharacterized protein n=1 Tax=Culex quinquefasciatus TaxID=7176 RepID=B0X1K0_CULQU|nr:conserved hypothetical protein [Culex quinquefasciatus]|eukprot:XP_001863522.1 conserved hypothetical protein [Culex quinquefasciatus]